MSQRGRISLSHAQAIAAQAPLEHGHQFTLEEAIARSKQQEAERKKLVATAAAQNAHAHKTATGSLKTTISHHLVQAFSISRAKAAKRSQRKNAKPDYVGPTPERLAKSPEGFSVGTETKAHTSQALLDKYKRYIPPEVETAARLLLQDFLLAESGGPRVTANYDGVGGSVPGPRHGGVQDYVREAQATVSLIRAEWPTGMVEMIEWFLAETVHKQDGSFMRLEDAGAQIVPGWTTPEAQKGAGWGRFYSMLTLAERFYARQRALGRRLEPPTANDARRLLSEIRARAQARRERMAKRRA